MTGVRFGFRLAAVAAVAALLGAGGCAGTIAGSGTARVESRLSPHPGEGQTSVRVAPELTWRSGPGESAATMSYAPTLSAEIGGIALIRHRASAEAGSGRAAGLAPFGALLVEYGGVRTSDLIAEGEGPLVPVSDAATLESYTVRGEFGLRGRSSLRSRVQLGVGVDRSAGTGPDAAELPELTRTHASVQGQHRLSRRDRVEATVGFSHFRWADSRFLLEADARTTRQLTERLATSIIAGGGVAHGAGDAGGQSASTARPAGGVAVGYAGPGPAGLKAEASLLTRPELDRLSGGLQQRVHGQLMLGKRLVPGTSVNGRVQWASDLAGESDLRRVLALDTSLRSELPGDLITELGARLVLQDAQSPAAAKRRDEARLYVGVSRRFGRR
jgi:hypothetical protein